MKGTEDASYRSKAINYLLLSILLIVANSTYCSLPEGIQSGNSYTRDDEIHEIYMLLTYSILYKTWQGSESGQRQHLRI